ncbi:ribosomal protein L22e [Phakopsora pachyrhizi]|uniref:Ribosomal protein L22e n=1 Tax=Phakopsora pachyrhizi TaxID=170000 RepID=A0AAV0BGZ8_PHAPC|nr:ribosomal protein L22e [Phakopsora pachyrhizi]
MSPNTKLASGSAPSKPLKFYIDYSKPASDGVFDGPAFVKFLHDRIKVEGRAGQLGDKIKIEPDGGNKVAVTSTIPFSKRYLKYLTKKYLKKHQIRNYIRQAWPFCMSTFELRYFLVDQEGDDDES